MADYPTPARIKQTANFRDAAALSRKLIESSSDGSTRKQRVAIIGGGLSGLACGKYLADAGHEPVVLEARGVLGGKVSAWQDADGDWIETGLHIFFGAYPNMMNLFEELNIEERLQWKQHRMTFAMQERPGEFTSFEFPDNVPAPFNMAAAILSNTEMLTIEEKVRMVPALLPMLTEGQSFIDRQDELSVTEFMDQYGMPRRINDEIFIAMGKALDFIDPDKLSMTVVLTAMNRFINEADGSQTAFLDGNQPDRLCAPMKAHIEARGGSVKVGQPLAAFVLNPASGAIDGLRMANGETLSGFDAYVSALPVDVLKRLVPLEWSTMPYFRQLDQLEGIPVINLQMWFDTKLRSADGLCFSRSPLLSVYADMSTTCKEYANDDASMLELVFAPCSPLAGSDVNWIAKPDEEIIDATMGELARLFPDEIANDERWPATSSQGAGGKAKLRKFTVVRVPRSVYAAVPGRNKYRPSQVTPVPNLVLAGCFTSQKYLGSMEGAVLAGKLAAEVIVDQARGSLVSSVKAVAPEIVASAAAAEPIAPAGVRGDSPIAFGGGQQGFGATAANHV